MPGQSQVVGQLAPDQACTDDRNVLGRDGNRGTEFQVCVQVVHAPAQLGGQAGRQRYLGTVGQHQFVEWVVAPCGAERVRAGADAGGLRLGQQAHAQPGSSL
jgi:hypothetical protein